ncbi:MAG: 50S ribosomal protein L18a [Candidatus Thorarchaeota archaeon]|jgi:large subunit ribosomal protein LX|nr:50S ribosomal protein L18a [Candidatus Thorarchaeota archaeon]
MDTKVWRAVGKYRKNKRTFTFTKELIALKESHARERIFSELGSRHRVKRRSIEISEVVEIKPEEVVSLKLRTILGVESVIG